VFFIIFWAWIFFAMILDFLSQRQYILDLLLKGICPRSNNKVVIIIFYVYDKCLFLMLQLYELETLILVCLINN
jgi:hypothetical protein